MFTKHGTSALASPAIPGNHLPFNLPGQMLDHGRDIAITLLRAFVEQPSYILGVTSAIPGEGKTTISLSLAEVMAADFGVNVLFVDAHAERPWTPTQEALAARPGLGDWLSEDASLSDVSYAIIDRCSVLPFGQRHLTSREVLQHLVKSDALRGLRQEYGLILLDLPDMTNPATPALANLCDGLILVTKAGSTPADQIRTFLPLVKNLTVHGVVLNRHRSSIPAMLRRMLA